MCYSTSKNAPADTAADTPKKSNSTTQTLENLMGEEIVCELQVTNDTAERCKLIVLTQEYSGLLTKDQEQSRFALQNNTEHGKCSLLAAKQPLVDYQHLLTDCCYCAA